MRDDLKPYVGVRQGGEPEDELAHFYQCRACGQPVDMRDLAAVFHHEDEGHEPLPDEEAMRLLSIEDRFRLKLMMETGGRA